MKFHDRYDGLIGNNILVPLGAKIDLGNKTLSLVNKELKLQFGNYEEEIPVYNIQQGGTYSMKIPVPQRDGLAYIPEKMSEDGKVIVQEGVYNVKDYNADAVVHITDDGKKSIKFKTGNSQVANEENFYVIDERECINGVFKQIDFSHLSNNEKIPLTKLINRFLHIFYNENNNLTFTNAINKFAQRTKYRFG